MKVNVEIDCSPEEARRFLGLPDVSPVNDTYVGAMVDAMKGTTSPEKLVELGKSFTPMGEMGWKLFQNFIEATTSAAAGGTGSKK